MPTIETARSWYPENDPVHGFDHVMRVYKMAERLAQAEGADLEIVRAATLLHDAEGPGVEESREDHQHKSALFAHLVLQSEGWPEERIHAVAHCIRAHRFRDDREQPQPLEAKVLFDADKLDAIGAIGAVLLGEFSEGGAVLFLFSLAGLLESKPVLLVFGGFT